MKKNELKYDPFRERLIGVVESISNNLKQYAIGTTAIVSSSIPVGVGYAEAFKLKKKKETTSHTHARTFLTRSTMPLKIDLPFSLPFTCCRFSEPAEHSSFLLSFAQSMATLSD